jgi:ATP-dependent endonuclease of the OLD family-like
MNGIHKTSIKVQSNQIISAKIDPSFFGMDKFYNIYYINFHKIKDEISTQKTSWGNLKSFLGKHIKKIVDEDSIMKARQENFQKEIKNASKDVLL